MKRCRQRSKLCLVTEKLARRTELLLHHSLTSRESGQDRRRGAWQERRAASEVRTVGGFNRRAAPDMTGERPDLEERGVCWRTEKTE